MDFQTKKKLLLGSLETVFFMVEFDDTTFSVLFASRQTARGESTPSQREPDAEVLLLRSNRQIEVDALFQFPL